MKYLVKVYFILFSGILFSIIYMYFSMQQVEKQLNNNIEKLFLQQAAEFAQNINEDIHKFVQEDFYITLKNEPKLRHKLEEEFSLFLSSIYRYVFVLYKDKKGDYRFLLDGSIDDKADFNQKLMVQKELWNEVYRTKKSKVIKHTELDDLWITYLEPIIINNHVEGIIAIDFSVGLQKQIASLLEPIKSIFNYIFLAIILIVLILLYQTFSNFKTKKDSITDALTKVYNRTYLRELLKKINISQYQIMMIDIDFFKKINDNYGHKAGDYILRRTAEILMESIRTDDILIRFGGEEFMLFVKRESLTSNEGHLVANRIKEKIAKEVFIYDNEELKITVSIGVNCHPERFKKVSDAIKYADEMLYIAKRTGRNKIVYTSKDAVVTKDKISIYDVKEALENNRILCYFQPIYHTKTLQIKKYEALLRLIDKNDKIITPNVFLGDIQNTNLYNDITKRVIENVFQKIKQYQVEISINLNFSDILDKTIFEIILEQLEENKSYAHWLTIELLENEYLEDFDSINQRLDHFKSFGVKIAVDDFGSGYSNFYMITNLHVDIIKIDGTLIKEINDKQTLFKVTKSIVTLVNELGLETVAEFVCNEAVYETVKYLGVDYVQGYYLSKPLEDIQNLEKTQPL